MEANVKSYARSIGAKWYQAWKQKPFNPKVGMQRNMRWMGSKTADKGFSVLDYGPQNPGNPTSSYYMMESKMVQGPQYRVIQVPRWK